jgi:hypothetical protein
LVAWRAGTLWRYEPFVNYVIGLIVSAEHNPQTSHSGVRAMFMARVKPIVIDYAMFVIHFAPNVAMTTQIYSW